MPPSPNLGGFAKTERYPAQGYKKEDKTMASLWYKTQKRERMR